MERKLSLILIITLLSALPLGCDDDDDDNTASTTSDGTGDPGDAPGGDGEVDGDADTDSDPVAEVNNAPEAVVASAKISVIPNEAVNIPLDGSKSTDEEGPVTFSWAVTQGTGDKCEGEGGTVCFDSGDATVAKPKITLPNPQVGDSVTVVLTVTDNGDNTGAPKTDTAEVIVTVVNPADNIAPEANAGEDAVSCDMAGHALNAGSSTDAHTNGAIADWSWQVTASPGTICTGGDGAGCFDEADIETPKLLPNDGPGVYEVTLTVTDNGRAPNGDTPGALTDTDTVAITFAVHSCTFKNSLSSATVYQCFEYKCQTEQDADDACDGYSEEIPGNVFVDKGTITFHANTVCDQDSYNLSGYCVYPDGTVGYADIDTESITEPANDCYQTTIFSSAWGCEAAGADQYICTISGSEGVTWERE